MNPELTARSKRVNRIKKFIISVLVSMSMLMLGLCVGLFMWVGILNTRIIELNEVTTELQKEIHSLKDYMEQFEIKSVDGTLATAMNLYQNEVIESIEPNDNTNVPIDNVDAAHKVYLTFDDGPTENTEEILDILAKYNVKATFFVLGKEDENSKEMLRKIAAAGHSIGMHSYTHRYNDIYSSVENFEKDFHKIQDYIEDVTGQKSMIYRFPGGSSNNVSRVDIKKFIQFLEEQGVEYYDWNVASGDGLQGNVDVDILVQNSIKNVQKYESSIILMHDDVNKYNTVKALPQIIESIQAMEDTVILPITQYSDSIQHVIN